jgi:hypothetical protein
MRPQEAAFAHQMTWTAIRHAEETQSPEGSKRSEEAAKPLDGGSAAWPPSQRMREQTAAEWR